MMDKKHYSLTSLIQSISIESIINFAKKNWLVIALLLIPVSLLITYILVIIPFPPAMGIDRNAWVSFFGSCFGGILGGFLSVIGVFLTLSYYRKKDQYKINDENTKKAEERQFLKDVRILNVRPYLIIKNRTVPIIYGSDVQYINIQLYSKYYSNISPNNNSTNLILSNEGMGTALNIRCKIKTNEFANISNYDVSLASKEKCEISMTIKCNLPCKEESFYFVFNFCDIFDNFYEQEVTISVEDYQEFSINNIQSPTLIKRTKI